MYNLGIKLLAKKKPIRWYRKKNFKYIFFYKEKKYLQNVFNKNKNFLITGGTSIDYFLNKILNKKKNYLIKKNKVNKSFYLSDERICSSMKFSNTYKIKKIFKNLPSSYKFYGINNFPNNLINEVKRYNNILPKKIDIAFLALGDDHHIASLFKNMNIHYKAKNVFLTSSINFKFKRISVNKYILSKAGVIYLFINGIKRLKEFHYMVKNKILNKYFNIKSQNKLILILKDIKKIDV